MLKRTPLNALHRALGAKMVDFGGWDMPLHYGSQVEEHHRVRRAAGVFDVSHMLPMDLEGEGAFDFLQRALANNVVKLRRPGKALYSCMLNERGGVVDDLIVYLRGPGAYRLVVNAATAEKDLAWLQALRERTGAGVRFAPRRDLAMLAVQGPGAREAVYAAIPGSEPAAAVLDPFNAVEAGAHFIARTGYTGEDGFEVMLPGEQAEALFRRLLDGGVAPCGLGARDTLRLEAGMNLYGQDMDEDTSPLEAGLAWTVDLASPRDFVGKAALLASPPRRRTAGLLLLGRGGVLRAHQKVRTPAGGGEITSGGFSPTLNASIAFARIPASVERDSEVEVEVRDRWLPARVTQQSFVRHGKPLVAL